MAETGSLETASTTICFISRDLSCEFRWWAKLVGHIMRLASYTYTSRHGIFYFRFPLPIEFHPSSRRNHIKLSMGTRSSADARYLARMLAAAGQLVLSQPRVRLMRCDDMRQHVRDHFNELLTKFKDKSAERGPAMGLDMEALRACKALADDDVDSWSSLSHLDGAEGLLKDFCASRGIQLPVTQQARDWTCRGLMPLLLPLHN